MENVVVSIFHIESEAFQAFSELKQFVQTENTKLAQASIVKAENGVINVKDSFDLMNGASVGSDKELINSALITTVSKKLTNGEVAIIALVQENDESVLNAIFEKYQVDIARWDVATVAAEIESALKIQEDLEHQAKARLIADKKEARREKFDKLKA